MSNLHLADLWGNIQKEIEKVLLTLALLSTLVGVTNLLYIASFDGEAS